MYISEKIAEFVTGVETLPPSVVDATHRCILDAVSAVVAGQSTPGGRAGRAGAVAAWGKGTVPLWLSSERSTAIGAAFANSTAASILDLDDGHRAAAGHPGASIVPAVLTAVQEDPSLAPRAVTAIAIGYEVGLRIAASRDVRALDTVITGRWCGQAVAAAIGWLKRSSPRAIAEAIAAAASVAPLMAVAEFTQVGNHVKEAIPHATTNGLTCLHLAEAGFVAPLDVLDEAKFFDADKLLTGLGGTWMIESCYFKPYSCCRWIHAPIDGLLKIMSEHQLSAGDITGIKVDTFGKAMTLNNKKEPKSLEGAQFSIPFCLGVVAVHGPKALVPMTNLELLSDADVLSLADLVEVVFDAEMDRYFPEAVPSRIIVSCGHKTYSEIVMAPLGEATNPMGWDALFDKYHALAASNLSTSQETTLRHALDEMRSGNLAPLLFELSQPANKTEAAML